MRRACTSLIVPLTLSLLASACAKGGSEKQPPAGDEGMTAMAPEMAPDMAAPPPAMTPDATPTAPKVQVDPEALKSFAALPDSADLPDQKALPEKVALGRMLYHDTRLSKNHDFSCNSCHQLDKYGVDDPAHPTSEGHRKQFGTRNSPTVYNAALEFAQFWDGREKDVEAQAKGPVTNPVEMALPDGKRAVAVLKSIPGYGEAFAKAFPGDKDPVTFENLARAIGAFERKLLTPSRWDKFLKGDQTALTDAEKQGFNEFVAAGCAVCHNGPLLGGDKYMKLGSVKPWPDAKDLGRYAVTKVEEDKLHFKVPMLRNVEKTGPYNHDGKLATLEDAVTKMAVHQIGKTLTPAQVASIITFLKALTGELPAALVPKPELPPSGPKTPKPDPA